MHDRKSTPPDEVTHDLKAAQREAKEELRKAMAIALPREAELLAMVLEQVEEAEFWADEASHLAATIQGVMPMVSDEVKLRLAAEVGSSMVRAIRKAARG